MRVIVIMLFIFMVFFGFYAIHLFDVAFTSFETLNLWKEDPRWYVAFFSVEFAGIMCVYFTWCVFRDMIRLRQVI